ncbi:MAG: O-antigen ligase family protein, partial [Anaerolineae bacterium]|nr:O-antigen ligase family protein [Anaerolineae bacterium]
MRILRWLDQWHWVWIALAAPFLIFPTTMRSLAMLVIPGVWIIGLLARREPLRRTPLNPAILLLAVMVLVSLYATYDFAQSFPKVMGMILAFGVYFATARVTRRFKGWWGAAIFFCALTAGMAVFALVTVKWSAKIPVIGAFVARLQPRIVGLQGAAGGVSPNELAGVLVWGIPVMLMLTLAIGMRRAQVSEMLGARKTLLVLIAFTIATIFTFAILVLTQSRGGYLGLFVALVAMFLVVLSWRWRIVLVGVSTLIVIAAIFLLPTGVLAPTENSGALSIESAIDTLEGRLEIWSRAMYGIEDFAFTGMGMNTFRRVVHVLYPLFLIGPDSDIAHAHNEFVQAALDLGVPGLIAFTALYIGAAMMLGAVWTSTPTMMTDTFAVRATVLGLGAGLLAHLVYGMTDAVTLGAKPGFMFWLLLGLIAGLYDQAQSGRLREWHAWFGASQATLPP